MLPQEIGRYIARPTQWAVKEEKGKPTFVCRFDLLLFFNGEGWQDIAAEQLDITHYLYLFKNDGQPNEFAIKSLKESFGWGGASLAELDNGNWDTIEVQLSLETETYNDKSRMKVKYINPRDWEPSGLTKAEPVVIQSLDQKYGPMLRSLGGSSAKPAAAPAKPSPATGAREAAWDAFKASHADINDNSVRAKVWLEDLGKLFPGKKSTELTSAEWMKAAQSFKNPVTSPIGDEQHFKEEDIPF